MPAAEHALRGTASGCWIAAALRRRWLPIEAVGADNGLGGRQTCRVGSRTSGSLPLAGRVAELESLSQAAEEAAEGLPSAVFVRGEAGVGKTRLVRAAAEVSRERGFTVLWGTCVRFGGIESPFLPWVTSVEQWWALASDEDRARIRARVPQIGLLVTAAEAGTAPGAVLGEERAAATDPGHLVRVLRAFVSALGALGPTLLVMDDVQWADPASRDALMFLLAGLSGERLLVLATVRDEGLPDGDPMHGWLADLRRLPSVSELVLGRFTLEETTQQLRLLLGAAAAGGLVRDAQQRGDGNPYLTELLCHDLDPDSQRLPDDVPDDLARALLAAWHPTSEPSPWPATSSHSPWRTPSHSQTPPPTTPPGRRPTGSPT